MALDKDDIKQLIAILQKGLIDSDSSDDTDNEDEIEEPVKPKRGSVNKKQTKKKNKNLFEQMAENRMHKDDVLIDQKLRKVPPTERARDFKPLVVRCRVCGREEKINPMLVESIERYKCNKCSTSAG